MESEIPKETPPVVVVSQPMPEKKRFHLNKWHVITVVLVAVIAVQGFLYLNLNSSYNTLDANHKLLTSEHQNLTTDYNTLTNQYSALQSEHRTIQDRYDSLQSSYYSLQSDFNSLELSHNSYVSSYDNLRNQINQRTLQSGVKDFIMPNDTAVKDKVNQITGGWSNPSDVNEYWSDVKTMYDWVVNNIEYRSDGLYPVIPSTPSGSVEYKQEMWQLPKETLDLKQGDCEDMAILLTSMILSYNGGRYSVECILIKSSTDGHAAVQFPVAGGKLTILDPAGNYYTQTLLGELSSKDITTEINNWLNYWKPEMGSDVYVNRVFSNHLDKSFSSTSEYTTWMYSR
jgi:hypothetical protein